MDMAKLKDQVAHGMVLRHADVAELITLVERQEAELAAARAPAAATGNLATWPAEIWLQHGCDEVPDYHACAGGDVISWCWESIHADDVRYIRADQTAPEVAEQVDALTDAEIYKFWLNRDCMDAVRAGDIRAQFISAARAVIAAARPAARPSDDELRDKTLRDRDAYHEWADMLAEAIATYFDVDIGEHSSANNPWAAALAAVPMQPAAPVQAALPEGWAFSPDGKLIPPAGFVATAYAAPVQPGAATAQEIRVVAAAPVQAAPEGTKLVPVESTAEMNKAAVIFVNGKDVYEKLPAGVLEIEESIYAEIYEAMIAAAPAPQEAM